MLQPLEISIKWNIGGSFRDNITAAPYEAAAAGEHERSKHDQPRYRTQRIHEAFSITRIVFTARISKSFKNPRIVFSISNIYVYLHKQYSEITDQSIILRVASLACYYFLQSLIISSYSPRVSQKLSSFGLFYDFVSQIGSKMFRN